MTAGGWHAIDSIWRYRPPVAGLAETMDGAILAVGLALAGR